MGGYIMKAKKPRKGIYLVKGGKKMNAVLKEEKEVIRPCYMANIKRIAQEAIKKKGLTEEEVRKSLGSRRYEK
jgi:hypothetical protein